jgi:chemotaxis signal transduction protein
VQSLGFPVGSEWYAVDFDWVREVVAEPRLTPIPLVPGSVLGLVNLRGEMVPVFDTGRMLGVGPIGDTPFVVVLDTAGGLAGLAATGLPVAVRLGETLGPAEGPAAVGIYAMEGPSVATLLDVEMLMAPGRLHGSEPL